MKAAWLVPIVLASACNKRKETPASTGSGSSSAVAVAPADAAPAADAAELPPLPTPPILLATYLDNKIIVMSVDARGVTPAYTTDGNTSVQFGWVDQATIARKDVFNKAEKSVVEKVVDGKVTESAEIADPWSQDGDMFFTADPKEVWLRRCTKMPEGPEDCTKFAYRRVLPAPAKDMSKPAVVDFSRIDVHGVQRPIPDATAPADIKLEKIKLKGGGKHTGIKCTSKTGTSSYPDPAEQDEAYGPYTIKKFRWVMTDPPIYEMHAEQPNPVAQIEEYVEYFRACDAKPMGGFIGLDGPLWGELLDTEDRLGDGEWIIRNGSKEVGRFKGSSLRPNR